MYLDIKKLFRLKEEALLKVAVVAKTMNNIKKFIIFFVFYAPFNLEKFFRVFGKVVFFFCLLLFRHLSRPASMRSVPGFESRRG